MTRIITMAFLIAPIAGFAHMTGGPHGVSDGLLHPLTGIDHLLALLAVGWIAHRPAQARLRAFLPVLFLASMLAGAGLGLTGHSFPILESILSLSLISLGLSVILTVPPYATALLLAGAGICHGFAHGAECPSGASSALFLAGMAASSATLLLAGKLGHRVLEGSRSLATVRLAISTCLVMAGALLLSRI